MIVGKGHGFVHIAFHTGIALKVFVDIGGCSLGLDAQILGQTKAAHAVNQTKVDDLGVAALLAADGIDFHTKHLRRRGTVHVLAGFEGVEQGLVTTQVGHDAQLDLRIVGAGNHSPLRGNKGFAHAAAFGRAHRNVLQVRVVAGQTPSHRHRLGVMRVHAARAWMRQLGQLVGVSALELGQAAVLQQLGRQRVIFGQLFQHFFIGAARAGRCLLHHGHAQLVEENFAQLLGRSQVEGLAGNLVSLVFQLHDARAQVVALLGQLGRINQHAVALNTVQGLAGRDFQLINVAQGTTGFQLGPQHAVHIQRLVSVFTGVGCGLVQGHLGKWNLVRTLAAQVFIGQPSAIGVAQRQTAQAVGAVHFQHIALQHGVVRIALHLNAGVGQHMAVVLDVLAQLGLARIFQPGLEARDHLVKRQLLRRIWPGMAQRNISRLTRLHAAGDADNLGPHFVK